MGFFSGVKTTWEKAQAAAIVQQLLEHQARQGLLLVPDPVATANRLVGAAWSTQPEVFEGKTGPKPHKASVAAFALAYGMSCSPPLIPEGRESFALALAEIINELDRNGAMYPFHHVDITLLEAASAVFVDAVENEAAREPAPWEA